VTCLWHRSSRKISSGSDMLIHSEKTAPRNPISRNGNQATLSSDVKSYFLPMWMLNYCNKLDALWNMRFGETLVIGLGGKKIELFSLWCPDGCDQITTGGLWTLCHRRFLKVFVLPLKNYNGPHIQKGWKLSDGMLKKAKFVVR